MMILRGTVSSRSFVANISTLHSAVVSSQREGARSATLLSWAAAGNLHYPRLLSFPYYLWAGLCGMMAMAYCTRVLGGLELHTSFEGIKKRQHNIIWEKTIKRSYSYHLKKVIFSSWDDGDGTFLRSLTVNMWKSRPLEMGNLHRRW